MFQYTVELRQGVFAKPVFMPPKMTSLLLFRVVLKALDIRLGISRLSYPYLKYVLYLV